MVGGVATVDTVGGVPIVGPTVAVGSLVGTVGPSLVLGHGTVGGVGHNETYNLNKHKCNQIILLQNLDLKIFRFRIKVYFSTLLHLLLSQSISVGNFLSNFLKNMSLQ
jgi:hypothetical protein